MLIDFKQLPRAMKFIGRLKFETFAKFNVQFKFLTRSFSTTSAVMRTSCCPIKKAFHTGCLLNNLFCHICARAQGTTPSNTQKLKETYDRLPSRRGHATLLTKMLLGNWHVVQYSLTPYSTNAPIANFRKIHHAFPFINTPLTKQFWRKSNLPILFPPHPNYRVQSFKKNK